MIAVFGRDELAVLGLISMLEGEKIPYRRITRAEPCEGELVVVTGAELSVAEIGRLRWQPMLVLNGGPSVAQAVFGARHAFTTEEPCGIALSAPAWSPATLALARRFGKSVLRIPLAPVCRASAARRGIRLASFAADGDSAAVMRYDGWTWCAVDLGAAYAHLLRESYLPEAEELSRRRESGWVRQAERLYYLAPEPVRRWARRSVYENLEERLAGYGERASEYPIDATGWLMTELLKQLILTAAGTLVRIGRWPHPWRSAASLTHDVEPRRYAYTTGLDRLLELESAECPPTFGLVAASAERHLSAERAQRLASHEVICHGLEHKGDPVTGGVGLAGRMREARRRLEAALGRRVAGYRSPRLDRGADLVWALDASGLPYDSSYPDVDRESSCWFGAGVRVNAPYRPLIVDGEGPVRRSRCLELPLAAPDCIQPLFAGQSVDELRAAVSDKAAFVRETGGLNVALVHGGVFGRRDSLVRGRHLTFVCDQLLRPEVWLARLGDIAEWWRRREAVRVELLGGEARLVNGGSHPVRGLVVVVESDASTYPEQVVSLAPGESVRLRFPLRAAPPAA